MLPFDRFAPQGSPYFPVSARAPDLPGAFCAYAVIRAFPSARRCSAPSSPLRPVGGLRIFRRMSIGCASRLPLRSRLTLIRLALIRNPWSYGGRVSRPPCRYLYLHLLFRYLQHPLRNTFGGIRNAPLPIRTSSRFHGFGTSLMPEYYPRGITRLVSCYALFE